MFADFTTRKNTCPCASRDSATTLQAALSKMVRSDLSVWPARKMRCDNSSLPTRYVQHSIHLDEEHTWPWFERSRPVWHRLFNADFTRWSRPCFCLLHRRTNYELFSGNTTCTAHTSLARWNFAGFECVEGLDWCSVSNRFSWWRSFENSMTHTYFRISRAHHCYCQALRQFQVNLASSDIDAIIKKVDLQRGSFWITFDLIALGTMNSLVHVRTRVALESHQSLHLELIPLFTVR